MRRCGADRAGPARSTRVNFPAPGWPHAFGLEQTPANARFPVGWAVNPQGFDLCHRACSSGSVQSL